MKFIYCALLCAVALGSKGQSIRSFNDTAFLQPIEVTAIRAGERAPFAKTNLSREEIVKNNLGQDLPFLLNQTPSAVINSDAGNGVGYTGIRIRGTDGTRINVTLNGIPYNDAESQGSFFVNLPDFASSANSIQIQRGVGTSSNGAGAFGATINLSTNEISDSFYTEINNSYGSFNTRKHTLRFGSGMLGKHFTIDGRLSNIASDGYVDRARSDLKSFYVSTAYQDENNSLRLNVFSGKERTYQSWNGIPENFLKTNRTFNSAGLDRPGAPYDNETDNYTQTHYQLFYNHRFNTFWKANVATFLTRGEGYYEQYRAGASLAVFGLPDYISGSDTLNETDLVRQLWLDNYFYGTIFSVQHQKGLNDLTIGGGWNKYDGKHFGKVVWAQEPRAVPGGHRWYDLMAHKQDLSLYTKWARQLGKGFQSFIDLQYRRVQYDLNGFRDNPTIVINNKYQFLNPKAGLTYNFRTWQAFISYAMGTKEPNRDDFEAGAELQPKPERLHDVELGIERKNTHFSYAANLYYMRYHNQLVLTGKINDVGAYTRTNIPNSYRAGIELQGAVLINKWLNVAGNLALSENKVQDFTEYIDDYDNGGQVTNFYKSGTIAFSPAAVGGGTINFIPLKNAEISLMGKYVSRQFLDNTSQQSRSLDPYFVQDIRLSYKIAKGAFKSVNFLLQLNNVFNNQYEANGYTFSYLYGGLTTENYYFPMAPFNVMAGINISF